MKSSAIKHRNLEALFSVMDKLVTEQVIPSSIFAVFAIIDYLQIISFIISERYQNIWGTGLIFKYIYSVIGCFNIPGILTRTSASIYFPLYFFCLAVILIVTAILLYLYLKARLNEDLNSILIAPVSAVIHCLTTIAYLPLLQIFLLQYQCTDINGSPYIEILPSIQCFSGITIFFAFVSALLLIIFIPSAFLATLTLYQSGITSHNIFGKYTAKKDLLLIALKTVIAFAHLLGSTNHSVIPALIFTVLIFTFWLSSSQKVYVDCNVNTHMLSVLGSSTFLSVVLVLGYAFTFDYFFEACLICAPLIYVCIYHWTNVKEFYFHKSDSVKVKGYRILEDVRKMMETFRKLEERKNRFWLTGRIVGHAARCTQKNCEINQNNIQEVEQLMTSCVRGDEEAKQRIKELILSYSKRKFVKAIQHNNKDIGLRLNYCLFILEELHNPLVVMTELKEIEGMECSILDRYFAYRYDKLVKSKKLNDKDKASLQQVVGIQQQSIVDSFESLLTNITHHYITMWGFLEDEAPEFSRVVENCFSLIDQLETLENLYSIMHRTKVKNFRIYMLYSSFFADVLREEAKSKKMMAIAEDFGQSRIVNNGLLKDLNASEIKHVSDETPLILVSGNENDTGTILNCNSSLGKLFGYSTEELVGKDISIFMPEMYVKTHTELLKEKKYSRNQREEIFVICAHRSKYIFPAHLRVLRMANMLNSYTYVATITDSQAFLNSRRAFVLLNPQLCIVAISSSSCEMLKLSYSRIKENDLLLSTFCPEVKLGNINSFFSGKKEVDYFYPIAKGHDSRKFVGFGETTQKKEAGELIAGSTKTRLLLSAGAIQFSFSGVIGYYCIFSNPEDTKDEDQSMHNLRGEINNKAENFQFRYDALHNIFVRELAEDAETPLLHLKSMKITPSKSISHEPGSPSSSKQTAKRKGSFFHKQDSRVKYLSQFVMEPQSPKKNNEELKDFIDDYIRKNRPDYAEGVKTYRLIGKEFVEVNEALLLQSVMEEAEADNFGSTASKKDIRKVKNVMMLLDSIKSKKALVSILKQISMPLWIKIALLIIMLLILYLLGISIYIETEIIKSSSKHEVNHEVAVRLKILPELELLTFNNLAEMLMLKNKKFTNTQQYYGISPNDYYLKIRQDLDTLIKQLVFASYEFYSKYVEADGGVQFEVINSVSYTYTLATGIPGKNFAMPSTTVSAIYYNAVMFVNIVNRTMEELSSTNVEEAFILTNVFPRIYIAMTYAGLSVFQSLVSIDRSGTYKILNITAGTSLAVIIILGITFFVIYKKILRYEAKILKPFLDVPYKQSHRQMMACQAFLDQIDNEREENEGSGGSFAQVQKNESRNTGDTTGPQKRRIFKGFSKIPTLSMILMIVIFALNLVYFILPLFWPQQFDKTVNDLDVASIAIASIVEDSIIALVAQREYFLNKTSLFLGKASKVTAIQYLSSATNTSNKLINAYNYANNVLDIDLIKDIHEILYGNLCEKYPIPSDILLDCTKIGNGVLTRGESMAAMYYEGLLRSNIEDYLKNNETASPNVFNTNIFNVLNILMKYILVPAMQDARGLIFECVCDISSTFVKQNTYLVIGFGILSCFTLVLIATIFLMTAIQQKRLRVSLTLLPICILKKIRRFRKYLQNNVPSESLLLGTMLNESDQ